MNTIPFLFLILLGISCNTSKKDKKEDSTTDAKVTLEKPIYSIDTAGTAIQWTAYKFTNKLGVSGTFNDYTLHLTTDSGSVEELLNNAKISIKTLSVNSGNEIRDPKLRTSFFKVFKTDTIWGEILDATNGKGALELKMNNRTNDTAFEYSLKNDTLLLSAHVDMLSWNGEKALKNLNKECYELHTGTDGISKLWPDVDVVFKMPVKLNTLSK